MSLLLQYEVVSFFAIDMEVEQILREVRKENEYYYSLQTKYLSYDDLEAVIVFITYAV